MYIYDIFVLFYVILFKSITDIKIIFVFMYTICPMGSICSINKTKTTWTEGKSLSVPRSQFGP